MRTKSIEELEFIHSNGIISLRGRAIFHYEEMTYEGFALKAHIGAGAESYYYRTGRIIQGSEPIIQGSEPMSYSVHIPNHDLFLLKIDFKELPTIGDFLLKIGYGHEGQAKEMICSWIESYKVMYRLHIENKKKDAEILQLRERLIMAKREIRA